MNNISVFFPQAYKSKCSFIATQMPLKDTAVDFWRLLYEQKVSTIVMLNQLSSDKPKEVQHIKMKIYLFTMCIINVLKYMFDLQLCTFMIFIAEKVTFDGFFQFNINPL